MDETESKVSDFIWKYRGLMLLVTLIIVILCLGYLAQNLMFIQQDPVKYCKKIFIANDCQVACLHELSGNATEAYQKMNPSINSLKLGDYNESG